MAIVAGLTAIYLVLGGYVATAVNDFIQGIIMLGGVVLLIAAILTRPEVGGFVGMFEKLAAVPASEVCRAAAHSSLTFGAAARLNFYSRIFC